jgi:hypothetical protein
MIEKSRVIRKIGLVFSQGGELPAKPFFWKPQAVFPFTATEIPCSTATVAKNDR